MSLTSGPGGGNRASAKLSAVARPRTKPTPASTPLRAQRSFAGNPGNPKVADSPAGGAANEELLHISNQILELTKGHPRNEYCSPGSASVWRALSAASATWPNRVPPRALVLPPRLGGHHGDQHICPGDPARAAPRRERWPGGPLHPAGPGECLPTVPRHSPVRPSNLILSACAGRPACRDLTRVPDAERQHDLREAPEKREER
jgi:hypothetical protein